MIWTRSMSREKKHRDEGRRGRFERARGKLESLGCYSVCFCFHFDLLLLVYLISHCSVFVASLLWACCVYVYFLLLALCLALQFCLVQVQGQVLEQGLPLLVQNSQFGSQSQLLYVQQAPSPSLCAAGHHVLSPLHYLLPVICYQVPCLDCQPSGFQVLRHLSLSHLSRGYYGFSV